MLKIAFILIVTMFLSCKGAYTETAQENPNQLELKNTTATPELQIIYNADSTTVKFKGVVTNAKNDCWLDATCSIEVDNKWWIAIKYGRRPKEFRLRERGEVTGIRFTKDNESIGKKVIVYAKIKGNKDQNKLTLEGSKIYYVKVIEN